MAAILATNTVQVARFADALYNIQLGSSTMNQVLSDIAANNGVANTLNAYFVASFGKMTSDAVADTLIANLGITDGADIAKDYVIAQLEAVPMAQRGAVVNDILSGFATLSSDATFGSAATAWNTQMTTAVNYAADSANTADVTTGTTSATVGKTFTLTTGVDAVTGTASDDSFVGVAGATIANGATLNTGDVITGGVGNDKLTITIADNNVAAPVATLNGIETVIGYISGASNAASAYNAAQWSGVSTVEAKSTTTSTSANTVFTVTNLQNNVTLAVDGIIAGTDNDLALNASFAANKIGSTTGTLALDVSNSGSSTADAGISVTTAGSDVFTKIAVNATGSNYIYLDATDASVEGATDLTVTGSGALTLSANTTNVETAGITKVDASANTGGLTIDLTGGSSSLAFTGGSGSDKLSLAAADVAATQVLDGGSGTDTLKVTTAADASTMPTAMTNTVVKNFEVLEVQKTAATATTGHTLTVDASALSGVSQIVIDGYTGFAGDADSITVSNLSSGANVSIIGSIAAGVGGTAVATLSYNASTLAGSTQTLNLSVGNASAGTGATVADLIVAGTKTLNIASVGGANILTDLSSAQNTTTTSIVVTGNKSLTITNDLDMTKLATIDASALSVSSSTATGLVISAVPSGQAATTAAMSIIGSNGQDTLKTGVMGGTITGGSGSDTMAGGISGKATIFNYTSVTDSTVVAANRDAVTMTTATDLFKFTGISKTGDFSFESGTAFAGTHASGYVSSNVLYLDFNGDSVADMTVGVTLTGTLSAGNFEFA